MRHRSATCSSLVIETYQRAEAAFQKVIALPAAKRRSAVAAACGGDDALIQQVHELLSASDEADTFFARSPLAAERGAPGAEPTHELPPAEPAASVHHDAGDAPTPGFRATVGKFWRRLRATFPA